ncbi:TPR domain protein [Xylaria flabelliformis]|nr:TPR domain protein [Xylaria flabelliformis]
MLQHCIANANQASLRRGQVPKDHPQPHVVINQFMRQRLKSQTKAKEDGYVIHTSQVPLAYPPSVRMVDDLVSMPISQMKLQNHHRGKKVILRVITPQVTTTAIMAIVEDEEGTAVLLQLYHQQQTIGTDLYDILHPNMVLMIKEPFFKTAADGAYSIRVDHVSDVVFLQNTSPCIPSKWKTQSHKTETSTIIRGQGNIAVKKRQWAEAEKFYSRAIRAAETLEEKQLACLNRSLANLQLHRPEKALEDVLAVNADAERLAEKRLFREARALYELGRFAESLEKWRMLTESYPQNADALKELLRTEKRIQEAQTGGYDFVSMYEQAKATPPIIDCATYKGPVAVREAPGRGNGLFTTKPVKAGDLLICEKAFAYCYADKDDPIGRRNMSILFQLESKRSQVGGQAYLLTDIVQKLYHSPQASQGFKALYRGDYTPVTVPQVDGQQIVDTFLVDRVISLNCFGAPRTTYDAFWFGGDHSNEVGNTTCGLWLLASHINHACSGNCARTFIGDMQIVRACQDIAVGTELCFPYQTFAPNKSYEEIQETMNKWGFVCDCQWCLDLKSTTENMLSKRKEIMEDLAVVGNIIGNPVVHPVLFTRILVLLKRAEMTYPMREGAVRLEVANLYLILGPMFLAIHRPYDAAEAILKGLEALGFDIVACPPRSGNKTLEIRRWGLSDACTMDSLMCLHKAYSIIAPELCPTIKQYAKIIYSICTGTDVTIGNLFPQLSGAWQFDRDDITFRVPK